MSGQIKIFISYSWDNEEHKRWVKNFADILDSYEEIHIVLDQYDLNENIDKNSFMETGVFDSDLILIICTEKYAEKANTRKGGVGQETYLINSKFWEETFKNNETKIWAIKKDSTSESIPHYLKGKLYISFDNEENFQSDIKELITKIKTLRELDNQRPNKTNSFNKRPINYFQFDRVDDILGIRFTNRSRIDSKTDFRDKKRVKYEFWKATVFDTKLLILILFNNITLKDTIEEFIKNNRQKITTKITVLRTTVGEKGYLEKLFKENHINIKIIEKTIDQFVWEECIDQNWKKTNQIETEEFFIDQRVFKVDDEEESRGLSLEYITTKFLSESNEISTLMLLADGGMGKSTLTNILTNKLNTSSTRIALLIQSENIRNNVHRDSIKDFEIQSIYQLYDIYSRMISKEKSPLTSKQFELGILTGKIVVIIDGLDEIISLFHSNFNFKSFISSIVELNKQLGKTKIIVTSRLNIQAQANDFLNNIHETDKLYLKGFEEDIWQQYIKKRFSKYASIDKYILKVEKYLSELLEVSKDGNKVVVPFFLDLISEIVEDEINNKDSSFIVETLNDEYISNNQTIDFIIYSILNRELVRQKFNIPIKKLVNFFEDISLSYGNPFTFEQFYEAIEYSFDAHDIEEIKQKLFLNPLINVNNCTKIISFKYDFLENYFHTLYILEHLSYPEIKTLNKPLLKLLTKLYDGKNTIFKDIVQYFSVQNNLKQCMKASSQIINLIIKEINISVDSCIHLKKAVSAILYLTQEIHGSTINKDERMSIIKELYSINDEKIKHLYIWGDFYPLDFSNMQIWSSEFHEFSEINKSKFDNCIFYHSEISDTKIMDFCKININNFDVDSCNIEDIKDEIYKLNDQSGEKKKIMEQSFSTFLRNFYNGRNFESKLLENITVSTKVGSKKDFIDILVKNKFLIKEDKLLKKYYYISEEYRRAVKNFYTNNTINPMLKEVLALVSQ